MSRSSLRRDRRRFLSGLAGLACVGFGSGFGAPLVGTAQAAAPARAGLRSPTKVGTIALLGALVHVGDGNVIKDGVVLIKGERISAVGGPELGRSLPAGAVTVDLSGKLLTPGFIASDTPLGLVEIGAEPGTRDDNGVGEGAAARPIRASYDAATAIRTRSSVIPVQAIEGITSAAVAPSGGLISGQVAWIDLSVGAGGALPIQPKIAVRGSIGQVIDGSRAATLAKLRQVIDDARIYRKKRGAYDRRQLRELAAHPRDLEALFPVLDRRVPLTLRAQSESDIAAALDLAAEEKLRLVLIGGVEAWRLRDRLAAAAVPVIVQPSQNLPRSLDQLGARLDNAALLSAAGVEVGIAILGGPHNLRNVSQEAGIAVAHGMAWEKALTAISLTIARAYGMDSDYGSVSPGKIANLVSWGGDPFEHEHFAEQVYVRGAAIPMVSRQTLLRERYRDLERIRQHMR